MQTHPPSWRLWETGCKNFSPPRRDCSYEIAPPWSPASLYALLDDGGNVPPNPNRGEAL